MKGFCNKWSGALALAAVLAIAAPSPAQADGGAERTGAAAAFDARQPGVDGQVVRWLEQPARTAPAADDVFRTPIPSGGYFFLGEEGRSLDLLSPDASLRHGVAPAARSMTPRQDGGNSSLSSVLLLVAIGAVVMLSCRRFRKNATHTGATILGE